MKPLKVRENPYQTGQTQMMPSANPMMQLAPMQQEQPQQYEAPVQEPMMQQGGQPGYPDFGQDPYMETLRKMYEQQAGSGNTSGANAIVEETMRYMNPYNQLKLQEMGGGGSAQEGSSLIQMGQDLGDENLIRKGKQMVYEQYGIPMVAVQETPQAGGMSDSITPLSNYGDVMRGFKEGNIGKGIGRLASEPFTNLSKIASNWWNKL